MWEIHLWMIVKWVPNWHNFSHEGFQWANSDFRSTEIPLGIIWFGILKTLLFFLSNKLNSSIRWLTSIILVDLENPTLQSYSCASYDLYNLIIPFHRKKKKKDKYIAIPVQRLKCKCTKVQDEMHQFRSRWESYFKI